jgi:hypothetical protein
MNKSGLVRRRFTYLRRLPAQIRKWGDAQMGVREHLLPQMGKHSD